MYFNFLHLSIQEILAGFYIATQLPDDKQVSVFNELFSKPRFSAVFQFYAAITKLQPPGIEDIVIRVAKMRKAIFLLSLLHCLYEAQDPSLCESVAQQLQHGLYLSDTTLTPSDCLCIGYFLSHVCKMTAGDFKVDLYRCSIGDQGCKYLVSGLQKCLDTHGAVTTLLSIDVSNNAISDRRVSDRGVSDLSSLLKMGCIKDLNLGGNGLVSLQGMTILSYDVAIVVATVKLKLYNLTAYTWYRYYILCILTIQVPLLNN